MTFSNLCNSCTNIGCEFQSGIVRTKCAFYMPPHIESDNCGNYVVQDSTTKNDCAEQNGCISCSLDDGDDCCRKLYEESMQDSTTKNDIRDNRVKNELNRVKDELEPTTKNCGSCRYYGSHQEVCNYCYKCSLWTEQEPATKNGANELISREDVLMCLTGKFENRAYEPSELISLFSKRIKALSSPSVTSQSRKGHWIPVTERLPEEKTAVLLSCDDMYLARLNPCIGWRNGNYWHTFSAKGSYLVKYPIAWMPLPQPYKAESEVEGGNVN